MLVSRFTDHILQLAGFGTLIRSMAAAGLEVLGERSRRQPSSPTSEDALCTEHDGLQRHMVPAVEECSIQLATRPDDPPLPVLRGPPRVYEMQVRLFAAGHLRGLADTTH